MEKKLTNFKKTELEEQELDITVGEFASVLGLEVLCGEKNVTMHISTFNINRPGLQLAGFYEHFGEERVQVIGEQETAYLDKLSKPERQKSIDAFFLHNFPCVVFSKGLSPDPDILTAAKKNNRIIFGSSLRSTMLINELSIYLNDALAPTELVHGGLMDIYGVGVLIIGKSSVGKSETALELLQRHHRLIADDAVCVKRVADRLIGTSPERIQYLMEVRGVGIIDIRSMYGAGSVLSAKEIDLCVNLEEWDPSREYNRLGDEKGEIYNILDVEIPMHTIPVKTGRNLAAILEVAAGNYRLKAMGNDVPGELTKRMKTCSKK